MALVSVEDFLAATQSTYTAALVEIALDEVDNLQRRLLGYHYQTGDWAAVWRLPPYANVHGYPGGRTSWYQGLYLTRDIAELKSVTISGEHVSDVYVVNQRILERQLLLPFYGDVTATVTIVDDTPARKARAMRAGMAYLTAMKDGGADEDKLRDILLGVEAYNIPGTIPNSFAPVNPVVEPGGGLDRIYVDMVAASNTAGFTFTSGVDYGQPVPIPEYAGEGYVRIASRSDEPEIRYIGVYPARPQNIIRNFVRHQRAVTNDGVDYDLYVATPATLSGGRTLEVRRTA